MKKKRLIKEVIQVLLASRRILITTHVNPDGDGISSELALYHYLKRLGKEVAVINRDPVPDIFDFLPGVDEIRIDSHPSFQPDLILIMDCGGLERTGLQTESTNHSMIVVIDHHLTNDHSGAVNLLDPKASATGELVYLLLRQMEEEGRGDLDYTVALCLYTSIFTDTGSFRYSNTSPKALSIASKLVSYGINSWTVAEHVYESKSFATLKLMGSFLESLGVSRKGRFAWGTIRMDDYRKTGAREEHTDGFVNFPRSIKGVEVALLFRELNADGIKISLRSKGKINVAAIAEKFGGGGHHNAAGCILKGSLEEGKKRVLQIVAESLNDEVPEEEAPAEETRRRVF